MITISSPLIVCNDENDPELGVFPGTRVPNFDGFTAARSGLLLAHDLLEHLNGASQIGPVLEEMQALGAVWYVRGLDPDLASDTPRSRPRMYSTQQSIGFDLIGMVNEWHEDTFPGTIEPPIEDEGIEGDFDLILAHVRKHAASEAYEPDEFDTELYTTTAQHYLRVGYRRAHAEYGCRYRALDLFCLVRDAFNIHQLEYEGQELILTLTDDHCTINPADPEEEYEDE